MDSTVILPGQRISPDALREQDVIILDDLAAQQLDALQWNAIEGAERSGVGVILIAGGNHLPAEYLNDSRLSALLPFDSSSGVPVWRTWGGADAYFRFQPTDVDAALFALKTMSWMSRGNGIDCLRYIIICKCLRSGRRQCVCCLSANPARRC